MKHHSSVLDITKIIDYFKSYGSQQSILPFVPKSAKWILLLVLLLNGRNFPFVWHVRIFRYLFYVRTYGWFKSRLGFETKVEKQRRTSEACPVGINPFKIQSIYTSQAVISACDYNFHMSNSSYAVALDIVRMKFVMGYFPLLYPDGGSVVIGGVCMDFIKEIPLNAKYEVISRIGSWDEKWFYLISHFVTFPKSKPKTNNFTKKSRAIILGESLPVDAVIHCTAVSRICFKTNRITIPPVIALACMGFQLSPSKFAEVQLWRTKGAKVNIRDFYAGGWRNVPEGQRWWEDAFMEIEQERILRLAAIGNSTGLTQTVQD